MAARIEAVMGTLVTIHVVRDDSAVVEEAMDRAFGWFHEIEERCTRFSESSELMQLSTRVGEAVSASPILFEAIRFALLVAEETEGAFDPTVGREMEMRGFNRDHRTRHIVQTPLAPAAGVSYRDVELDPARRTIALGRPLVLDLGAVAKGFAVDMAARELLPFEDFAIDAGGDLYLGGRNPAGTPWSVGIRHPRRDHQLIETLRVSNAAVCTSGDYERTAADPRDGHHILDPRAGASASAIASVTVVAPTTMAADALATAAFVLGPRDGVQLLERQGVEGLIFSPVLERYETRGLASAYVCGR